jgi:serine/threonine-protein kinase PRP4
VSKRGPSPLPADSEKREAKYMQGYSHQHDKSLSSNDEPQASVALPIKCDVVTDILGRMYQNNPPSLVPDAPEEEPIDEATLIEQRRKRREAIKAKYRGSGTPLLVQALQLADKSGQSTPGQDTTLSTASSKQRPKASV